MQSDSRVYKPLFLSPRDFAACSETPPLSPGREVSTPQNAGALPVSMPPGESWTSWTPAEMGSGWRSVFQTRVPDKAGCGELRHPVGPHPLGPVAASTFVKGHRTEAAHARPVKARRAPNAHCPSDLRRPWEGFLPKSASASRAHTPAASDGPASWRAPGRTTPRACVSLHAGFHSSEIAKPVWT